MPLEELKDDMPRQDQLPEFNRFRLLKFSGALKSIMKVGNLEKAFVIYKYALEYSWEF